LNFHSSDCVSQCVLGVELAAETTPEKTRERSFFLELTRKQIPFLAFSNSTTHNLFWVFNLSRNNPEKKSKQVVFLGVEAQLEKNNKSIPGRFPGRFEHF